MLSISKTLIRSGRLWVQRFPSAFTDKGFKNMEIMLQVFYSEAKPNIALWPSHLCTQCKCCVSQLLIHLPPCEQHCLGGVMWQCVADKPRLHLLLLTIAYILNVLYNSHIGMMAVFDTSGCIFEAVKIMLNTLPKLWKIHFTYLTGFMFDWLFLLCFLYSSMYDQLSHPDCDSRPSCKGEDLYLEEVDPLP